MKWFLLVLATVLVTVVLVTVVPGGGALGLREDAAYLRSRVQQFAYQKELQIQGLERLTEDDVKAALPWERSVWWWLLNSDRLALAVADNPLVKQASFSRCRPVSWGCFQVQVKERQARMLARFRGQLWLVGEDGGFMAAFGSDAVAGTGSDLGSEVLERRLPIVEIQGAPDSSPEVLRQRFRYLDEALRVIAEETELAPHHAILQRNGELRLRFQEHEFEALFDLPEDDLGDLRTESRRLMEVLAEFGPQSGRIAAVDLAFKKVAVVKLRE